MAEITKKITVDVAQPNVFDKVNYVTAKQGDKGSRFVCAKLANESEELKIDQTSTVILNAYKPDGTRADKMGKVNPDGSVTVEITSQMLAANGQVDCDISIIGKNGAKLTTTTFYVQVQPAAIPDGSVVSSDEYSAISDLLLRVQAVDENETTRQTAENLRVENNTEVKTLIDSFVGKMVIANAVTPGAVKAGGDIKVTSAGIVTIVDALKLEIVKLDNPIGTVREFAVATNPSVLLGFGTWVQVAKGRTVVGVDTSDADFNAVGKQGGKKSHLLVNDEMANHAHGTFGPTGVRASETGATSWEQQSLNPSVVSSATAFEGGNKPHNNLQPYVCYYIWERTS